MSSSPAAAASGLLGCLGRFSLLLSRLVRLFRSATAAGRAHGQRHDKILHFSSMVILPFYPL
jgi:hypothetical protein